MSERHAGNCECPDCLDLGTIPNLKAPWPANIRLDGEPAVKQLAENVYEITYRFVVTPEAKMNQKRLLESKIVANEEVMELLESQIAQATDKGDFARAKERAEQRIKRVGENMEYRAELKKLERKT